MDRYPARLRPGPLCVYAGRRLRPDGDPAAKAVRPAQVDRPHPHGGRDRRYAARPGGDRSRPGGGSRGDAPGGAKGPRRVRPAPAGQNEGVFWAGRDPPEPGSPGAAGCALRAGPALQGDHHGVLRLCQGCGHSIHHRREGGGAGRRAHRHQERPAVPDPLRRPSAGPGGADGRDRAGLLPHPGLRRRRVGGQGGRGAGL